MKLKARKTRALVRLEAQLKSGVKPEKVNGKTTQKQIPLNDSDKKRLGKVVETLKSRT